MASGKRVVPVKTSEEPLRAERDSPDPAPLRALERPGQVAAAAPGAGARVPDFFIVGHEKCGTSALDEMLKEHPSIFMPHVKEQRFFVPELRSGKAGDPRHSDRNRPHTFEEYLDVFAEARPDQLIGEASPQYLRSRSAAARIAEVKPDARIIAILREPASFLRSFHLQWVHNNKERERDFRKAIELEPARRAGDALQRGYRIPETLFYSDHVRYVEQLRRYEAVFPREQMLVLIYEDFRRDNQATVRRVLRFLGLDDTVAIEPVKTQPLGGVRSYRLKRVADLARGARQNPAGATRIGRAINALTPGMLRHEAVRARWRRLVYKPPDPPDEQFMRELRARFKPQVIALSEYLGRDMVSEWGYEEID